MKIRKDFVTNSSSSSFIIAKKDVEKGKLLELLLEMANEYWGGYTEEDVTLAGVANYYIIDSDKDPVGANIWGRFGQVSPGHYVINNDYNCRYDFNLIDDILGREGIPYDRGYCD